MNIEALAVVPACSARWADGSVSYTPLLGMSFTLYIRTIQCSVVYASSITSNSKSLLPISALRTRS